MPKIDIASLPVKTGSTYPGTRNAVMVTVDKGQFSFTRKDGSALD